MPGRDAGDATPWAIGQSALVEEEASAINRDVEQHIHRAVRLTDYDHCIMTRRRARDRSTAAATGDGIASSRRYA